MRVFCALFMLCLHVSTASGQITPTASFVAEHMEPFNLVNPGTGLDEVAFRVAINPGSALQDLGRVASGGELSRLCLAIKVSLSEMDRPVSMIFDEVDAGIGGATAQIVGEKLRAVAGSTQVFCITHLPQVAACGHAHFKVEKQQRKNTTTTTAMSLPDAARIAEVARMLGGLKITDQTRAHAQEMLRGTGG